VPVTRPSQFVPRLEERPIVGKAGSIAYLITHCGATPATMQPTARMPEPTSIVLGDSWAASLASPYSPKNMPLVAFMNENIVKTLTIHARSAGIAKPACSAAT
jgi:hypothetical protein